MGFYWNPWSVAGTLAFVLGCALAALIYATNPRRLQNRALAVYLALLSVGFGFGVGIMFAADDARTSLALQAVSLAGLYGSTPVYLLFLSTLPTRTMRFLRPTWVRAFLIIAPLVIVLWVLSSYDRIVAGVVSVPYARQDSVWTDFGTRLFEANALTTATLGIVAAIGVLVESKKGGPTRRQAKWYAATFIIWELLQLSAFTLLEVAFQSSQPNPALYTAAAAVLFPGASLLLIFMLGYSILSTQLFDIDLKVKLALNKGTIGAAFLAVFFMVSKLAESLADRMFGGFGWVVGAVAAGLMLFALRPLERLAHGIADTAMPNTKDTPSYAQFRKMEVYKATLESFIVDGKITSRERDALHRLAAKLGIASGDAVAIEADVRA